MSNLKQLNKFIIEEWAPKLEEEDKNKNKTKKGRRKIEESRSSKDDSEENDAETA